MALDESHPDIYGGSGNRVIAFVLDGMVVAFVSGLLAGLAPGALGGYVAPAVALVYLAMMPLTPLQATLGKWVCRIRLCDRSGRPITWRASALRASMMTGWFCVPALFSTLRWMNSDTGIPLFRALGDFWWFILLLPWATLGFRHRHESLFDLLAGTLVVRSRTEAEQVANDQEARPLRLFSGTGILLLCLLLGASIQVMLNAFKERTLRARVVYAINETRPLQPRIEDFHEQMRRWPTAAELGLPAQVNYPDGGHYRLDAEGTIVITFSVLPELKGRSVRFRPVIEAPGNSVRWVCQADAGLDRRFLTSSCR